MKKYSSGNSTVDRVGQLNFTGNMIPTIWYQTIMKPVQEGKRLRAKPNVRAIIILADILYWYRPTEIRDQETGHVVEVRRKFKGDMLQRSYDQIAEQFGFSKLEVQQSIKDLKELGVVIQEFRTVTIAGVRHSNVMFLDVNVDRLMQLTYPQETENEKGAVEEIQGRVPDEKTIAMPPNEETNTKNSLKNSPENSQSFYRDAPLSTAWNAGLSEREKAALLREDMVRKQALPYVYLEDEKKLRIALCVLAGCYDQVDDSEDDEKDEFREEARNLFIEGLMSLLTMKDKMKMNNAIVTADKVYERLLREIHYYPAGVQCEMTEFMERVLNAYTCRVVNRDLDPVKNHLKYMQTLIWNMLQVGKINSSASIKRNFG